MRAIIQRVSQASVNVEGRTAVIGPGLVVFLGIGKDDTEADLEYLFTKIVKLRIFSDPADRMNRSLLDAAAELLVISQFTLYARTTSGNRPDFFGAALPQKARLFYEKFIAKAKALDIPVKTGSFGARMAVSLTNDGPVTLALDSADKIKLRGLSPERNNH